MTRIVKGLILVELSSPDEALLEGALDVVLGADGLQLAQVVVEVLLLLAAARVRVMHLHNQFNTI